MSWTRSHAVAAGRRTRARGPSAELRPLPFLSLICFVLSLLTLVA